VLTIKRKPLFFQVKEVLSFVPNFLKLIYCLVDDSRVPIKEKAILLAVAAYILSPFDFLPDIIPFLGKIDDLLLLALILQRFINSVDRSIVLEYWEGDANLLELMESIMALAGRLLPPGVYRRIVHKAQADIAGKDYVDVDFDIK
jgi:uncharacterized membrane protein YkvA (DUF1232 family)